MKVSRDSVYRWLKRSRKGLAMVNLRGQGRRPVVNSAASARAVDLLLEPGSTSTQVAQKLHSEGLTERVAHRTTVAKHAKATAAAQGRPIHPSRAKPTKELAPRMKALRVAFSEAHERTTWARVMFTDRKKFMFRYPGCSVKPAQWLVRGQRRTAPMVNHPMCVNMYGGITKFGPTKPHFVTGTSKQPSTFLNKKGQQAKNITSAEYDHVVHDTLLPEGRRLFGAQGIASWVMQQDNDPTHKTASKRALARFNQRHGSSVSLLEGWPGNSPDLNPIENAWAYVQQRVDAAGCSKFEEFKATLHREWMALPKEYCAKLVKSMRDRLGKCVSLSGDKTGY